MFGLSAEFYIYTHQFIATEDAGTKKSLHAFDLNRRQLKQYCMYLINLVNTCSRSLFFFSKTSQSEPRRVNNFSMTLDDAVSSITSVYSVGNDAFSPEDTLDSI